MKKINTLKLLCLCALGCICTTNAMAQSTGSGLYRIADERAADLEPGKDYVIYNTAIFQYDRTGFIYANTSNGLGLGKKKPVNKNILTAEFVWTVETGTDGKYYLKSKSLNKYVGPNGNTNNDTGIDIIIEKWTETTADKSTASSENQDGTSTTAYNNITDDNRVWVIGLGNGNSNSSWWNGDTGFTRWSNAHPFAFYAVEELGEDDMVQVTYTYSLNGQELGEKQVTEYNGCAPTEPGNVPVYVTATNFPAIIPTEPNDNGSYKYTIETTYNDQLPFQVSTDETSVYYRIKFNSCGWYWYASNNNEGKEAENCNGLTLATEQNYKWQIVGDWFNGFNIKAQSGKYLSAKRTDIAAGRFPTGTDLLDAPDAAKSYFLLKRNPANTFWRFNLKGTNLNLAHTSSSSKVIDTYYPNGVDNYAGGQITFEEMGDFQTMLDELATARDRARGFLDMTHIGTPATDAAVRTALQTTVSQIEAAGELNNISYQAYSALPTTAALTTDLNAYLAATDVQMPESGKAYTIVFRPQNAETGTYRHINFTGTTLQTVPMANKDSEIPESGVFVCRTLEGGKFAMVPAYASEGQYGKYMKYRSHEATASDGVSSEWNADLNAFTINPMVGATNNYITNDADKSKRFGCVYFTFANRRLNSNSGAPEGGSSVYIIRESDGSFNGVNIPYFNGTFTTALIVKEVEDYPSSVQLRAVDNIEGITAIGTFSAPYAAIVPEGVTAHYISSVDNKAQATAIAEGEAIPAGQGVLLTGEAGTAVMQPATAETQATIEGNLLGNTAGAAKALTYGSDYILTGGTLPNGNQGVAFYPISATDLTVSANKAYLHTEGANAPALVLSFGEGETDGVKGIDGAEGGQAPVFDLQGRRVQKAVKGLYIQNGKKFMVK